MKKLYTRCQVLFSALTVCFLLMVSGCGYTLQGKSSLPFANISIGRIVNNTFEPKLEDILNRVLVDELLRNGFVLDSSSGYTIEGTITSFELRTLSARAGQAAEYEVIIKGDFRLAEPSGNSRGLRSRGVFTVSFQSGDALQGLIALKEKAIEKALRDLSSEIAASVIYK